MWRKMMLASVGLIALAALPGAAVAQCSDGPPDTELCCIGPGCGVGVPGFVCYSVSADNRQCWGQEFASETSPLGGPAFTECEFEPGFAIQTSEGVPATPCDTVVTDGAVSQQLLRGVGGYGIFESQILRRAEPRVAAEARAGDSAAATDGAAAGESDEGGEERAGAAVLSDITTTAEVGSWDFRSVEGDSVGARYFWSREGETGRLRGFSVSYQEADPDFGSSTRLVNGNVSFGHTLGASGSWGVSATVSDFSGLVDDTMLGGSGYLAFSRYSDSGSVVSGGVLFQYLATDLAPDDVQTVGYGLGFGFPLGRRAALDLEAYGVSILEGELVPGDDQLYTAGAHLSLYLTPRFALTLGYRLLEGIDDLDSSTFTFGGSVRWQ